MIMWYHKHHLVVSSNQALVENCKYFLVAMKNLGSVVIIPCYDYFPDLHLIFNLDHF